MSIPSSQFTGEYEPLGKVVTLDPAQPAAITTAAATVSGLTGTSTAAYTAVANSLFQTSFNEVVSYYMTVATNGVTFEIRGSVDGTTFVAITGTITAIAAAASGLVTLANGGYLYYKLYMIDTIAASHGTVTGAGFCI